MIWSTLPAGSPTVPQNRPTLLLPGRPLRRLGRHRLLLRQPGLEVARPASTTASPAKPFAIPEFGVSSGDDPRYVQHLIDLGQAPRRAARCSSTTRTSAPRALTGSRTTRRASPCSTSRSTRALPRLRARSARTRRHRRPAAWPLDQARARALGVGRRTLLTCRARRPRPAGSGASLRDARPAELPLRRGGDGRPGPSPGPLRHRLGRPQERVDPPAVLRGGLAMVAPIRNRRGRVALALRPGRHGVDRRVYLAAIALPLCAVPA